MSKRPSVPEARRVAPATSDLPPPSDMRPPPPPGDTEPQLPQPVDLGGLLSGLLNSLSTAKQQADVASASLTQTYSQDNILRNFPIPVFNFQELEIDLRFAVQRVETPTDGEAKIPRIFVNVDASTLAGIKTESLANAKLKINPTSFRIYQGDDKQVVVSG